MLKYKKRSHKNSQSGVVSILVSVIIMIILTLIAVGFAQLMRREQRQALDRQLSAQAFYAAETAINDATQAFANGEITGDFNSCQQDTGGPLSQRVLDEVLDVEYTCVTLDYTIESIEYDSLGINETKQTQLNPVDDDGNIKSLKSINFQWESAYGNLTSDFINNSNPLFPVPGADWPGGRPGLIRLEIIPLFGGGADRVNRDILLDSNNKFGRKVFFLLPSSDGSGITTINWNDGSAINGSVYGGNCKSDELTRIKDCAITIDNLPASSSFVTRITSIYRTSSVSISGTNSVGDTAYFDGAQIVIDATGKASDVLRRVRANISLIDDYPVPDFAIQSFDGLCKQLVIEDKDKILYTCPPN